MELINDRRRGADAFGPLSGTKQIEAAPGAPSRPRRLHSREEVGMLLQLNEEQVQFLISTRQITRIRIAGEERIDSRDVEQLIEAYKATAKRKAK